jgi:hypothetical protein
VTRKTLTIFAFWPFCFAASRCVDPAAAVPSISLPCFSQSANKQMVKYLRANHFVEPKTIKLRQRLRPCLFSASFQTMVSGSFLLIIFANTTRIKHAEMIQNSNFSLLTRQDTARKNETNKNSAEWFFLMTTSTKVNFYLLRK